MYIDIDRYIYPETLELFFALQLGDVHRQPLVEYFLSALRLVVDEQILEAAVVRATQRSARCVLVAIGPIIVNYRVSFVQL